MSQADKPKPQQVFQGKLKGTPFRFFSTDINFRFGDVHAAGVPIYRNVDLRAFAERQKALQFKVPKRKKSAAQQRKASREWSITLAIKYPGRAG